MEDRQDFQGAERCAQDMRAAREVPCWAQRGCAGVAGLAGPMERECPHNVSDRYSPCPATCAFTRCQRPWHEEATALEDLLDPDVDRMQTIKEQCRHCLFFIKHGPRSTSRTQ
ncbi:MAG: hypothetical protein Q4B30_02965 [Coriobacteriaceae bacterium]|nr:hypothetical protein [Coriobacteriaceae bacterium]